MLFWFEGNLGEGGNPTATVFNSPLKLWFSGEVSKSLLRLFVKLPKDSATK